MCGIITALSTVESINQERFDQARDILQHRGPDAAGSVFMRNGYAALGHRRLSILDLSAAANQPMQLGRLWVTFNGEIYNYPELKKELETKGCHFRTTSDTEALLHGYQIWGHALCHHLAGMFAFAIWDDASGQLFLARDHIGQKPLYYAQARGHFVAASEIKAIRALLDNNLKLRAESILDTIVYDSVPEPYTWYQEVECLPPGHSMLVEIENQTFTCAVTRYWDFWPDPDPPPLSRNEALERMGAEIEKAVRSHLLADVEVGAFLSGGADSTCIVTLANAYVEQPLKTFSIGFGSPDGDELPLARETARRIGAIHQEGLVVASDFQAGLDHLLHIFDQPFADTSSIPTERVSALAAQKVQVVLTGDGGDETFGGYNYAWYISPSIDIGGLKALSPGGLKRFLITGAERAIYLAYGPERWQAGENFMRRRLSKQKAMKLFGPDLAAILRNYDPRWAYYKYRDLTLDPFRRAQWLDLKISLPSRMLVKVDRASMQHSLETRSPFLSHTLVETMLNMPTAVRNPPEQRYKGLFRAWLKEKVSDRVLQAPKRGFGAPTNWYLIPPDHNGLDSLPHCVAASLIRPAAWRALKWNRKLFWKFLQLERALAEGLFSV